MATLRPRHVCPSDWDLPLRKLVDSAVGQLKEGSVPNHIACVLEIGSHSAPVSPHSGILTVRATTPIMKASLATRKKREALADLFLELYVWLQLRIKSEFPDHDHKL